MRTLRLFSLLLALAPFAARAQDVTAPAPAAPVASPAAPAVADPPPPQVAPAPQAAPSAPVNPAPAPAVAPPNPAAQPAQPYPAPAYPAPYPAPGYPQPSYAPAPAPQAPPAAAYVPPPGYPAPPPGYTYAPVPQVPSPAEAARRDQLYSELLRVDTRLAEIERARAGLAGPIAMVGFGYGALLFSSAVALSAYAAAEAVEHGDYYYDDEDDHGHHHHNGFHADDLDANDDGYVDHRDERRFRRLAYGFTGVAAFGLTAGIIGTVKLTKRIAERRRQGAERKRLLKERENLRNQLDYGVGVMPHSLQLNVQGHF
jgi:hypothetical protein